MIYKRMIFATQDGSRIFTIALLNEMNPKLVIAVDKLVGVEFEFTILSLVHSNQNLIMNTDKGLFACGANYSGELGLGYRSAFVSHPTSIPFAHQVFIVACGNYHAIIYSSDGLYATGNNEYGQLGLGHTGDVLEFTKIDFEREVTSVVCRNKNSLLVSSYELYSCGMDSYIEDGTIIVQFERLPITEPVISVAAGDNHIVVQVEDGIYILGDNTYDQLSFDDSIVFLIKVLKLTKIVCPISLVKCARYYTVLTFEDTLVVQGTPAIHNIYHRASMTVPHRIINVFCSRYNILIYTTDGMYRLNCLSEFSLERIELENPQISNDFTRRLNRTKSARK